MTNEIPPDMLHRHAELYIKVNWGVIKLRAKTKLPVETEWQKHPIRDVAQINGHRGNIGVQLGHASGGLVDVDLDCQEAIELAPQYLPLTLCRFSRATKPRSHWLYKATGKTPAKKFYDHNKKVILEIRGDHSTGYGGQTAFPPSVHPSGEHYYWEPDTQPPPVISYAELSAAVERLAEAVRIARGGATKSAQNPARPSVGAAAKGGIEPRVTRPPAGMKEGDGRDARLFKWACSLFGHGKSYDEVLADCQRCNAAFADKLTDAVVEEKVKSAEGYFKKEQEAKTAAPAEVQSQLLPWHYTEKGRLATKSYANAHNGLLQIELKFQHDVFHDKKLVNGKELSDGLCRDFREQILRCQGVDPGIDNVRQAAERLCEANAFDPVVDYVDELKWDGKPRVDTFLIDYFGAEDTPLNRAISSRVIIASVRRARKPGTKFDEITVLESPEGFGKSEALSDLYGAENFSDQKILSVSEREIQEKFGGVWCAEIADLTGMKRADIDEVKATASRVTDRSRPAYGHYMVRQPRRTIIWATTNDDKYLRSQTGNRRFLPVKCGKEIDKVGLRRDRDQLWAEAAVREAKGEATALPRELWAAAQAEQNARLLEDPWDAILEGMYGHVVGDEERVLTKVVLKVWLEIPPERQTEAIATRLRACMKRQGWEHKTTAMRIGFDVGKGYVRPARAEAVSRPLSVVKGGRLSL